MSNLLTEVLRKVVELPEDRQDDAARVLMLMLEHDPEQYRLSDEQLRDVQEAIAEVDAGKFASDEEIDRVLHHAYCEGWQRAPLRTVWCIRIVSEGRPERPSSQCPLEASWA